MPKKMQTNEYIYIWNVRDSDKIKQDLIEY